MDHYYDNCTKAKKKLYAIEKVPEEAKQEGDSESDSISDAISKNSNDDKDPREEFLGEYQEEAQMEVLDIQFEAGLSQGTAKTNLCKHTQDAQKLREWHTFTQQH
ncbi:hypothetical protein O181_022995 [Austropuccinia psidii MF-1]|uniref:Uncharacterized protein n=1 Tax=Austropuccinia psidii MF-1 TaxID=1389203 RepID=A0A9Q3GYN3_9BASI|nr:hypothetical protein [Austropuccinia psidii MF-1]